LKADLTPPAGRVYLVGAGPGDPELLTLRAVRLLGQADVIVYDNLVSPEILKFAQPTAQKIYAGKRRNEHTMRQEQINLLLVKLAQEGKRVVRLKGGDPFIFGRGGEEMQELAANGVVFEVVPGITAACGVASYAGIPLTHRDHAQSCVFVTGNLKDGSANLDWDALVREHQTVVIYMGLNALPDICRQLVAHGAPATRPVALVQHGTTASQQVLTGTLADLPGKLAGSGFTSPSLIIVGDVVKLHGTLAWFSPVATEAPLQAQPVSA
jgi:uroporphyrin-III C-methyltransferase/precorrin-2 dehydrogenase/sirohydrochlorin ferrochelatase